jgi:hypothetical protein
MNADRSSRIFPPVLGNPTSTDRAEIDAAAGGSGTQHTAQQVRADSRQRDDD